MKIQIFKTKKEFRLFDLKNALCLGLFYLPMLLFLILDLKWILFFALSSVFFGLLIMLNLRFFSNEKLSVTDNAIAFSNSKLKKIEFHRILRVDVLIEEKTFKTPIFLIIYFEEDYIIIRFDKFNFKNPKKEYLRFKKLLPENIKIKLLLRENEYFTLVLNSLEKMVK